MIFPLPLHLSIHVITSIVAYWIVVRKYPNHKLLSIIFTLLGGFLIDLDHLFDYFLAFGTKFNLVYFLKGYEFLKSDKIYIPLHAWEWVIVLLIIYLLLRSSEFQRGTKWSSLFNRIQTKSKSILCVVILSLTLSISAHLLVDSAINEMKWQSYTMTFRLFHAFRAEELIDPRHNSTFQREKKEFEQVFQKEL